MDDAAANWETRDAVESHNDERLAPVGWGTLRQWFAPWIIALVLAVTFVVGLWTASVAVDSGTELIGFAAAAAALLGLVWDVGAALDGRTPSILVDTAEALAVLSAILAALAIGGLILAARSDISAARSAGYALFVASIALAFWNVKHYFDRIEARERSEDGAG